MAELKTKSSATLESGRTQLVSLARAGARAVDQAEMLGHLARGGVAQAVGAAGRGLREAGDKSAPLRDQLSGAVTAALAEGIDRLASELRVAVGEIDLATLNRPVHSAADQMASASRRLAALGPRRARRGRLAAASGLAIGVGVGVVALTWRRRHRSARPLDGVRAGPRAGSGSGSTVHADPKSPEMVRIETEGGADHS